MNTKTFISIVALSMTAISTHTTLAQTTTTPTVPLSAKKNIERFESVRHEIYRAIERGNEFLKNKQSADGVWGSPEYPALSALALAAAVRAPQFNHNKPAPEYIQKGYALLLAAQKPDGGIYGKGGLASYNTSVCLLGLLAANKEEYAPAILKARKFLINQQNHFAPDNPFNGGIGYGGADAPATADLSNTSLALEAIHYSKKLAKDGKYGEQPDLNWDAAIQFISRCQDLPETNDQKWATGKEGNRGGFAYRPNETKADGGKKLTLEETKNNTTPLRTYGSMSYAGLQSLIYADLKKDDPRIKAVLTWLSHNFSLTENPGMDIQGLYYYYQAMSKALSAAGIDDFKLADGTSIDWRNVLGQTLITKQKPDGSWVNTNNRWWETDSVLVTAYTVLALEQLYNSLPLPPKANSTPPQK